MTRSPVGERVELARCALPHGQRILYGQRIHGVVRITDCPVTGRGRAYLVQRGLTRKAELDALVADYVSVARRTQSIPMQPRVLGHVTA